MAIVVRKDGTSRQVKNLGWLVRHKNRVASFEVFTHPNRTDVDALLRANMQDGSRFECDYASAGVLQGFLLARRVWKGVPCYWFTRWICI